MEKIKDIAKSILPEGGILVEIIKPKRMIVTPEGTKDEDSYAKIIALNPSIKDLEPGDIVIKYGGTIYAWGMHQGTTVEKEYGIMYRGNINIAVKPDNFIDPDILTSKVKV